MRIVLAAAALAVALAGCSGGSTSGPAPAPAARTAGAPTSTPTATLTVAADGCGVIRSEIGDPQGLQWSIRDPEGFQVLARNAKNETRYRYFRPGRYSVVLEAFLDGGYAPVSNTVGITCG